MKVIITTRLEAGLPQKLDISKTGYIRLLPFNKQQVTEFFKKYGLPDITFNILKSYNLAEEEIFKPLFCWMFAIMRNSKSFDITTVFKDFDSRVNNLELINLRPIPLFILLSSKLRKLALLCP